MNVDIQSLGTFNRLAHEGAQAATHSLALLTGIDAVVDVTKITLVGRADLGEELAGEEFVGVEFDVGGALRGRTVLVFEADSVEPITDALIPGNADGEMARSGVEEVGNIMMSGFIDGWADYLGATIDHSPPEYIERDGADVLPAAPDGTDRDHVFVFTSAIEWVGESVNFYIYMLPEYRPLADLMADHADAEGDAIPMDKLEVFNRMSTQGVPKQVGNDTYVGTVVEFTGVPSGYLMVLFDEASARHVAEALTSTPVEGEGLTDRHGRAIEELGNIMTSGFVDGWANVLQTSIDHTPPRLVHDMGHAIVDPLAAQVGQHQEHAFIVDSTMKTEAVEFECAIYALPNEAQLREALTDLDVERADETEADAEQLFE